MKRISSNKYSLVPSLQTRKDPLSPMALVPVLPILFDMLSSSPLYAIVDTSAKISKISSNLLKKFAIKDLDDFELNYQKFSNLGFGYLNLKKLSFSICDSKMNQWIYLKSVPFIIEFEKDNDRKSNEVTLGYDSCLSKLRLIIDYPRTLLKVTAPINLLYSNFKSSQSTLPSRVIEGEKLIELGSYNAAIAMVVAGLEEILITKLGEHKERYSLSQLVKKIDADWLTEPLKNELKEIMTIRNQAVHGHLSVSLTKSDAQKTLKKVKYIIYKLT